MLDTRVENRPPAGVTLPPRRYDRRTLLLLSVVCAVGVSNIYFNQPLLLEMGRSLHAPPAQIGQIAVATQVGYALGIFFFVPLGDIVERRGLMARLFAAVSAAALASALARGFPMLLLSSVAVGLTAAVTHVAVPIAPELAPESDRGRAVGAVMTGLLLGILLARSFAGALGAVFGWRSVFGTAAALNLLLVPLLLRLLPRMPPRQPVPYLDALRSLWTLASGEALLRESALVAGLVFAAFSAFWTTVVFLLGSPHYRLGPSVAGALGVLAIQSTLVDLQTNDADGVAAMQALAVEAAEFAVTAGLS